MKPLLPVCGDFMVVLWCGVIGGVRLRIFDLWFGFDGILGVRGFGGF